MPSSKLYPNFWITGCRYLERVIFEKCAGIKSSARPRNVPKDLQTQQNTRKSFRTEETKT